MTLARISLLFLVLVLFSGLTISYEVHSEYSAEDIKDDWLTTESVYLEEDKLTIPKGAWIAYQPDNPEEIKGLAIDHRWYPENDQILKIYGSEHDVSEDHNPTHNEKYYREFAPYNSKYYYSLEGWHQNNTQGSFGVYYRTQEGDIPNSIRKIVFLSEAPKESEDVVETNQSAEAHADPDSHHGAKEDSPEENGMEESEGKWSENTVLIAISAAVTSFVALLLTFREM